MLPNVDRGELKAWFCREVLPLEPALTRFIRRNWRVSDDVSDIRQDVYENVLENIDKTVPVNTAAYVFTVAKNILINRARRANVVSIELIADFNHISQEMDWLTPERHVDGRQALRRVLDAIDILPPRCREVIRLRKVEHLCTREVADRLGIGIDAVQQQTMFGMRAISDYLMGGDGRVVRPSRSARVARRKRP